MDKRMLCCQGLDGQLHVDRKAIKRHVHVWVDDVTGGWHFDGMCWDDIKVVTYCRTCGKVKPEIHHSHIVAGVNDPITI